MGRTRLLALCLQRPVLLVPPSDGLSVCFVRHPNNIVPEAGVAPENDGFHVPLDLPLKSFVRAQCLGVLRNGEGREVLRVCGNCGNRKDISCRVTHDEIIPSAKSHHVEAGKGTARWHSVPMPTQSPTRRRGSSSRRRTSLHSRA